MTHTPNHPNHLSPRAPDARSRRSGYVYVLEHNNLHYKIGKAEVWVLRVVKRLAVQLPFKVTVAYAFATEDRHRDEGLLHRQFHSKRLNGEWFALDEGDLEFIREFANHQGFSVGADGVYVPDPLAGEGETEEAGEMAA